VAHYLSSIIYTLDGLHRLPVGWEFYPG